MKQDNGRTHTTRPAGDLDEDRLRELLQQAGPRAEMPEERRLRVASAVRDAWEQGLERGLAQEPQRHAWRGWAVAAALVAAIAAGWMMTRPGPAPAPRRIATVELEAGSEAFGFLSDGAGETFEVTVGDDLPAGVRLMTAGGDAQPAGYLAVRMAGGESVRLDAGTRVRLASVSRLELERGAVYVDSDPLVASRVELEIVTPLGVVRHFGTQYEVRFDSDGGQMRVRVREGSVSVRNNGDSWAAVGGEELTLTSDGSMHRQAMPVTGDAWLWAVAAAPALDIEGMPLDRFLRWIGRETGWRLAWADAELERSAAEILLHGSVEGLRPDEAVGLIVEGSGLSHRVEDGVLYLDR